MAGGGELVLNAAVVRDVRRGTIRRAASVTKPRLFWLGGAGVRETHDSWQHGPRRQRYSDVPRTWAKNVKLSSTGNVPRTTALETGSHGTVPRGTATTTTTTTMTTSTKTKTTTTANPPADAT